MNTDKFRLQEDQYNFPYHYLPEFSKRGINISQSLAWGLDYLTYLGFVVDQIVDVIKPTSILDVGCGDGRLINMLDGRVPCAVGVDLAPQAIAFAKAFNPDSVFYLADVTEVEGKFNLATLTEVLEHIPDAQIPSFIQKIAGKLEPGSHVLITVPSTNIPLNKKHYRHYDAKVLESQIGSHFEIVNTWYLTKDGWCYSFLTSCLQNRFFITRVGFVRRWVWQMHCRFTYFASETTGRHVVALAKLR